MNIDNLKKFHTINQILKTMSYTELYSFYKNGKFILTGRTKTSTMRFVIDNSKLNLFPDDILENHQLQYSPLEFFSVYSILAKFKTFLNKIDRVHGKVFNTYFRINDKFILTIVDEAINKLFNEFLDDLIRQKKLKEVKKNEAALNLDYEVETTIDDMEVTEEDEELILDIRKTPMFKLSSEKQNMSDRDILKLVKESELIDSDEDIEFDEAFIAEVLLTNILTINNTRFSAKEIPPIRKIKSMSIFRYFYSNNNKNGIYIHKFVFSLEKDGGKVQVIKVSI